MRIVPIEERVEKALLLGGGGEDRAEQGSQAVGRELALPSIESLEQAEALFESNRKVVVAQYLQEGIETGERGAETH
jgi:hypothetical protein